MPKAVCKQGSDWLAAFHSHVEGQRTDWLTHHNDYLSVCQPSSRPEWRLDDSPPSSQPSQHHENFVLSETCSMNVVE